MIHPETHSRPGIAGLQTITNRHAAKPISRVRRCSQGAALVLAVVAALHFGAGTATGQGLGLNNATPHASSILDLEATDRGLLIPRMTEAEKDAIVAPATSLMIYQTDGADPGFHFYNGTTWERLGAPFTGNNPATCISELWVSGIGGCSPVTFYTPAAFSGSVDFYDNTRTYGRTVVAGELGTGFSEDPGTAGQVLVSNGAGYAPGWANATDEYATGVDITRVNSGSPGYKKLRITRAIGPDLVENFIDEHVVKATITGNTNIKTLVLDWYNKITAVTTTFDVDDADANPLNEVNTSANLTGTDLNIIDAGGTLTVDLSSLSNGGTDDWKLTGNAGTVNGTNFLGTTDAQGVDIRTDNAIRMRIDATGQVGIGTTAPNTKLQVLSDDANQSSAVDVLSIDHSYNGGNGADGIGARIRLRAEGDGGSMHNIGFITGALSNASSTATSREAHMAFDTYDDGYRHERFRVYGIEEAGIARISWAYNTASTIGAGTILGALEFYGQDQTAAGVGASITAHAPSTWGGGANDYPTELQFHTTPDGTGTGLSQRMVIDEDGKVGIGVTNPSQPLDVYGDVEIGGGADGEDGSDEFLHINAQSQDWYIGVRNLATPANGDFHIGLTQAQDGMFHIEPGGNVGIGTISPGYKLDVEDDVSSGYAAEIHNTNSNFSADVLRLHVGANQPGTSNYFIGFSANNTSIGAIRGDGAFGVALWSASDKRLKQNIIDLPNALETIDKIRPRQFEYKINPGVATFGFVAQELKEVYPIAVAEGDTEEDMMMVSYAKLTPVLAAGVKDLHKMVKEQQAIIDGQKEEINVLQAQMKEIKQTLIAMSSE